MKARLRLYPPLRTVVGASEVEVQLAESTKVKDLPGLLETEWGKGVSQVLDGEDSLIHMRILINGRDLHALRGCETVITDGDTVTFLPRIVGG